MAGPLFDAVEREQLSDLFNQLGPDAPTLLGPWTTRDLAAHLVLREHDLLAGPGLVLRGVGPAGRTSTARARAAGLRMAGCDDPIGTATRVLPIGWVRRLANLNDFFVHHEDENERARDG